MYMTRLLLALSAIFVFAGSLSVSASAPQAAGGPPAEAVPITQRAYEIQKEVLGPDHQSTLVSLSNLGIQLLDMGRKAEAEPLILKASADCERVLGRMHPSTISAMNSHSLIVLERYVR